MIEMQRTRAAANAVFIREPEKTNVSCKLARARYTIIYDEKVTSRWLISALALRLWDTQHVKLDKLLLV